MPTLFEIGKPDQIDRLIALCADLGFVGRVELLRAVRRGEIALSSCTVMRPCRDGFSGTRRIPLSSFWAMTITQQLARPAGLPYPACCDGRGAD